MTSKFALIIFFLSVTSAFAQYIDRSENTPKETGQSAFAALAEIVTQLRKNENTNWSSINIDALQEHLVDMDNVTIYSKVESKQLDEKIIYKVTGQGPVVGSIHRMLNAHAPMLANETGWLVKVDKRSDGAIMSIICNDDDKAIVKALGFYGAMTIGAHHQIHHKMIASGHDPH